MLKNPSKEILTPSSKANGRSPVNMPFSRQQLLKHLALLNTMPSPLPSTLPPSPPASRICLTCCWTLAKRKPDVGLDSDNKPKRLRTDSSASAHPEDGEVADDHNVSILLHLAPSFFPTPALSPSADQSEAILTTSSILATLVFWSTYPPSHKEYAQITNAPPPNSLYHIHGGMVAKLELMEALVMFVYSLWCKDYGRGVVNPETWLTMDAYISWCKSKWTPEEGSSDVEKAFYGLIFMFNAFIHARIVTHCHRKARAELQRVTEVTRQAVSTAIADAVTHGSSLGAKSQSTPPMLPSPASIGATSSANSTPTNRDAANSVSAPLNLIQLGSMNEVSHSLELAISEMTTAQTHLNFSTMARHFPRTFARMVHSTLKSSEEHEVDFEDDDGELFWPGQSITGEGLAWLCFMGEGMVKEFGKQFEYKGLKGVVPKPDQLHPDPRQRPPPPGVASQR
ncbi:hypothetical protein BDP27DRAFT_1368854 [Rhodocollybia butyracea]|uniref:Uncharacterized protein n=1 Tax=Rhodocollybia butyracea TaxID=206335 RepID=A0A9P5PFP9_9AGAR|nr:hypothetical protein BDP27DRAFT_1368854 [Rhodocollybia butyracea]